MPKKPTRGVIDEWRRLRFEDRLEYDEIGIRTGWQGRTAKKYVEAELRLAGVTAVRTALFQERLGQHMDTVVDGALRGLDQVWAWESGPIGYPDPGGRVPFESLVSGVQMAISNRGAVSAALTVRRRVEWGLLEEHLPKDPLWPAAKAFESAVAAQLRADRVLYERIAEDLSEELQLGVRALPSRSGGIDPDLVRALMREIRTKIYGGRPLRLVIGDIKVVGNQLSFWSLKSAVVGSTPRAVVKEVTRILAEVPGADIASAVTAADERVGDTLSDMKKHAEDLRLMHYLPGTCRVCRRFEVR